MADIRKRFADRKRRDRLSAIASGWSSRVRKAFKLLRGAEDALVETRIRREVDLSGTGCTTFMLEETPGVDFARIAYPELSASTVLAQITRLRSHQLQSLLPR